MGWQEVAAVDGLYRIQVPRVFLLADRQTERQMEGYLTAFVRAVCIPLVLAHKQSILLNVAQYDCVRENRKTWGS